jgi:uncharacterized phage infection (PIP) family protein YhgE
LNQKETTINNLELKISNLQKDLNDLKNSLNEKETTINNQELTISNLQKNLNESNDKIQQKEQELLNLKNNNFNQNIIQYYQNIISQKDQEIFNLKNNSSDGRKKIYIDQIVSVNFISMDGSLHYSIPCATTDIFAEIEEKLYKKFPKYRETNNYFLYNGKNILRFKTIGQNKIENGMPITLCVPQ